MNISAIFMKICNMSLTATYCIAAVILLRFLLRKQPKIFSYLLWSVVLFRLLCPVSVSGDYSLLRMDTELISQENLTGYRESGIIAWHGNHYLIGDGTQETDRDGINGATAVVAESGFYEWEAAQRLHKMFTVGGYLWLAGIVILAVYSLWTTLRFRKLLQGASRVEDNVFEMEGLTTPFVLGIVRPRIYLPARIQAEERKFVLEHERVHISRRDYLIKILAWGTLCFHWFNPVVWLAYKLMEQDMEMSCDEAVIRKLGYDVRKEYSGALLSLSCDSMKLGGCPIAFGEGAVKSRVQNILSYHKKTVAAMVFAAILLIAAVIGLSMNPVSAADDNVLAGQIQFVTDYANAFCDRNGNDLVGMYLDETTAFEDVIELYQVDGGYTFGYSSPWPDEFRFLMNEENSRDEGKAEIWYYAWTSDPHIAVWKEELEFTKTQDGYRVSKSTIKFLDSISSAEEFKEAYWVGGAYRFTDYKERGFVEAINAQTQYDIETGDGIDRNAMYRNPDTAAEWIFNLTGGVCMPTYNSNGQAAVRFIFLDGSFVEIPMYDVNFDGYTSALDVVTGSGPAETVNPQLWIPDLQVWNAKAP